MNFIYTAVTENGEKKDGAIEAVSKELAIAGLQRRGLIVTGLKTEKEAEKWFQKIVDSGDADEHAAQLAALLNDARTRIDAALHGLEIQQADVGKTNQCTHPNCNCWTGVCSKGPHGPTSERLMRKFYGPPK